MSEGIQLMVQCEDCKHTFAIGSEQAPNSLTNKKEYTVDGQSIFLTYYDCPSCGRRHFVQIDDIESLSRLRIVKNQFIKLSVAKRKGKEIPQKQSAKFKKTRKDLSDYRTNLMKQFTDKTIHDDETNSDFVLRFSV